MNRGSYRIRWESLATRNVEELRLDVERKDIYAESDLLSDSTYYTVHFTHDWQLDDFELHVDNGDLFRIQRQQNGMWVDRTTKKVLEQFFGFEYFDLSITPLTHIMPLKRLNFEIGQPITVDVAYFDVASGSYEPRQHTYTKIDDTTFNLLENGENITLTVNEEGFIIEEQDRFKMLDFQIW